MESEQKPSVLSGIIRMQLLTEKLANLQSGLQQDKKSREDVNMFKIQNIETKVQQNKTNEDSQFANIKEAVIKYQEELNNEVKLLDEIDTNKSKDIRLIENNFNIDINIEKQGYKESITKLGNTEDEKFFEVKLEVARSKKSREDADESIMTEFAQSIAKINNLVEEESNLREEGYNKLLQNIADDIAKYYKAVEQQTKIREELNGVFSKMVENFQEKVKEEINKERQDREKSIETLLKLLEDTCNRVEGVFSQVPDK
ncbi:unnamed protein product [Blepharisma stoltei]|uniref:Uncharacterized protein n=1 Tax=Blepharisma stoltei TaxID=1481888 RepID=A0AAU9KJZ1_9CILI|nr:unnamed protein product [Blepharisma stoltei]